MLFNYLNASLSFTSSRAKANVIYKKYCMYKKVIVLFICSKSFSDASNSSDIEEEIIKQINTLKPFDMEPLFLRYILYRKKKLIVKKKLIEHRKIQ